MPASPGTEVPGVLTASADVETVRPVPLTPRAAPVVNSPAINVILLIPTITGLTEVVHTMVSVATVVAQLRVAAAPRV